MGDTYEEKVRRVMTTLNHQEPDKVPIMSMFETFSIPFAGGTIEELNAHPEKEIEYYTTPHRAMYKAFNELAGMLVLDNANQLFYTGLEKISNFLYIYLDNINKDVIMLTQNDIMDLVGINLKNVSRCPKILRDNQVIETRRNRIIVRDREKLRQYCSAAIIS
ncbi:helix-turn-helix domain-containing protein [Eubacteriaceae bacterium ES3]|nr:helix-turn-helix domain-containing protein [Eubacteriaceae bacterium ES3]